VPKLYVHNWKSAYLKRVMDRYGMTPELLVAFSGTPIEHIRHMLSGRSPVTVQVAAIARLYAATPKVRRLKIAKQLVDVLPPQNVRWRAITDYPDYEVSERGEVRRRGLILRPVSNKYGHQGVTLYNGKKYGAARGRKIQVHRIVALTFISGPPFPGAVVRHINGHPHDNRSTNLRWGTSQENTEDRKDHFRNGKPQPSVEYACKNGRQKKDRSISNTSR